MYLKTSPASRPVEALVTSLPELFYLSEIAARFEHRSQHVTTAAALRAADLALRTRAAALRAALAAEVAALASSFAIK